MIGLLTILAFLSIIFRSQNRPTPITELPNLKKVVDDGTSTVREPEEPARAIEPIIEAPPAVNTPVTTEISDAEADSMYGTAFVDFTDEGFEPVELEIKLNQKVRWTNRTDREITIYQTTYKRFPEWDEDKTLAPGESFEFRFYKNKLWTYKERASGEFGSVFVDYVFR